MRQRFIENSVMTALEADRKYRTGEFIRHVNDKFNLYNFHFHRIINKNCATHGD